MNMCRIACGNARPRSNRKIWVTKLFPQPPSSHAKTRPDKKATALLKLIYLEMFGYDMSWAAFNVLEVMSSSKYLQKRVGYLGAVQSFRPDTEVLMLATNMLKKVRPVHSSLRMAYLRSDQRTGYRVCQYSLLVPAAHHSPAYHHSFAGHVSAPRYTISPFTLKPCGTQEDDRVSLPACIGIPGSTEAIMAQNQGPPDG